MPAIRLRWWNLSTETLEVAELPAFEIAARGPSLAARVTRLDGREIAAWLVVVLLGLLAGIVVLRVLAPRALAVWRRRRADFRASEPHAFAALVRALRRESLGEALLALERWSARLPTLSIDERARLARSLTPLGAAIYGPGSDEPSRETSQGPSREAWREAISQLRGLRSDVRSRARSARRRECLPPLNPRPEAGAAPGVTPRQPFQATR